MSGELISTRSMRAALSASISPLRMPSFVFTRPWSSFFFFEAELFTEPGFLRTVDKLRLAEGSKAVCLGAIAEDSNQIIEDFLLNSEPGSQIEQYRFVLEGKNVDGWAYSLGRQAAISDIGAWCIYAETDSEIAVIAFDTAEPDQYVSFLDDVVGRPIDNDPPGYIYRHLPADWEDSLLVNYS